MDVFFKESVSECSLRMMMMAEGILGPCSDQVIEGVTVKVESDEEGGRTINFNQVDSIIIIKMLSITIIT